LIPLDPQRITYPCYRRREDEENRALSNYLLVEASEGLAGMVRKAQQIVKIVHFTISFIADYG
jgi:hypothetical protein